MTARVILILILAVTCWPSAAQASNNFLAFDSKHPRHRDDAKAFQEDILDAMTSMLGCGGEATPEKMALVIKTLKPMWRTMPKTSSGRIDRRTLRYLVHRYFMQTSSLMVRGFEPTRSVNDSNWGVADILSQKVPAYVESVLEAHHAKQHGFSLDDSVSMVLMLEQLIWDSESLLLEKAYADQRKPTHRSLSHAGLKQLLEGYIVQWMVEGDAEDMEMLLANRTLVGEVVPHFEELVFFAEGRMKALRYAQQQKTPKSRSADMWANKYSFEDAHQIVGGITKSFQSYWQSECNSMKDALVSMDELSTGRIPLAKFYSTAINSDWRFGESESYLRELGALDESSSWKGPQVIIPNYIQATSNCIVSTSHYLVCCTNECEALLGEIEVVIGAPTAKAQDILQIVGNMTSQTTMDDDESPRLAPDGALATQLQQVANINSGSIPLHGRLFAQWLHFAFPRECPFPHKMGQVSAVTPTQYGDDHLATEDDMRKHASNNTAAALHLAVDKKDLQWMSQWSPEEEFMVDYSNELRMSWQTRLLIAFGGLLLISLGGWGGVIYANKQPPQPSSLAGRVHWI